MPIYPNQKRSSASAEKFSYYLVGKPFLIKTDHKNTCYTFGKQNTRPSSTKSSLFLITSYKISMFHMSCTRQVTAYGWYAPINTFTQETTSDTEMFVQSVISTFPATKDYIDKYRIVQLRDHTCSQRMQFCDSRWPNCNDLKGDLRQVYFNITVNNNLLLFGSRTEAMTAEAFSKVPIQNMT